MLTSAPGSSENRLDKEQSTSKNMSNSNNPNANKSLFFKLWRKLVEIILATFGEVGLQNFSEQIPFQQVVSHGEKLPDNLVKILWKTEKKKLWRKSIQKQPCTII